MTASFFRDGRGHSLRGAAARERGARPWSTLPKTLRRDLNSDQAAQLGISQEWHHTGKFAARVHVYYVEQVEAYWDRLDADGIDARGWLARIKSAEGNIDLHMATKRELRGAQEAAEEMRAHIEEEEA